MADMNYFKSINSAVLIEEIKQHPELYDPKVANGNPEIKRRAWEEVAEALFDKQWAMFAAEERDAIIRELQVKWKSLRDNFTRVLRKEKEDDQLGTGNSKPKKKYLYFDQLKFLAPYTSFRKKVDNIIFLDENKESDSFHYSNEENPLQTTSDSSSSMHPLQYIHIQPRPPVPNTTTSEEEENSATKRIATVLEQFVAIQKEEKSDDPMWNKKFLLSLLPFMKKLPDDVNLEVRLQLMSVLQSYTSGRNLSQ